MNTAALFCFVVALGVATAHVAIERADIIGPSGSIHREQPIEIESPPAPAEFIVSEPVPETKIVHSAPGAPYYPHAYSAYPYSYGAYPYSYGAYPYSYGAHPYSYSAHPYSYGYPSIYGHPFGRNYNNYYSAPFSYTAA